MKLKYYLRGLGIGVVVTAIIMSIAGKPQELTDAQIKSRAAELGMVEKSVLADLQAEETSNMAAVEDMLNELSGEEDNVTEETVEESTEETASTETDIQEETIEDTEAVTGEQTAEATTEEQTAEVEEEAIEQPIEETEIKEVVQEDEKQNPGTENTTSKEENTVNEVVESYTIIKVERGNGSEVVSRRLYEAGLVESAVEYNQFLVTNGYDRRLSVGNHEIPAGASYEEMARILCGMK